MSARMITAVPPISRTSRAVKGPPGRRSAISGVRASTAATSSGSKTMPASCAIAGVCSAALVEPPVALHAVALFSADHHRPEEKAAAEQQLEVIASRFPDDKPIQRVMAKVVRAEVLGYSGSASWVEMLTSEQRLTQISERFPDDAEIRLQLVTAIHGEIVALCENDHWTELPSRAKALDTIAEQFKHDIAIQRIRIVNLGYLIIALGQSKRLVGMQQIEDHLFSVAQNFRDDREIQLNACRGAIGAIYYYVDNDWWEKKRATAHRIAEITSHWPSDPEFQDIYRITDIYRLEKP
jgi:hypothetical protein